MFADMASQSIRKRWVSVLSFGLILAVSGCSSSPPIKTQGYAKLKNERDYETDFPAAWKAIEAALSGQKIVDRDPEEVSALELRNLTHRSLETDWIYGRSRDKYQEYQVNGSPRKTYLQTRYKYLVEARSIMGGIHATVIIREEVEKLKSDGTPAGYESAESDSSRASELLDKIQNALHSAAP